MVIKAIKSVLAQERYEPEIVVVDDGSVDRTREAVGRSFPKVKLVSTPGLGPGRARNEGARAATGDVFMFLDSDDVWLPHHVSSLMPLFEQGFEVAYGVTKTTDCLKNNEFFIPGQGEGLSGDCFGKLVHWCFLVPSSTAVTRRAFRSVGGFGSGDMGEDWAFFLTLASLYPFGFTAEVITHRLLHGESLCCLKNGAREIQQALERIMGVLRNIDRTKPEDLDRVRTMNALAAKKGATWETIQDWYASLKGHGLL
jgi:glycosyltransferase involved in cell wall biosynthesis